MPAASSTGANICSIMAVMGVEYREEPCRSALNRVKGMGFGWSLNPYMGCAHRCTFCYVRAFELRADRPSDDRYGRSIRVKVNVAEVLRKELARPTWHGEIVAIGAATDPYQPAEGRYRLTRGCLEALRDASNPFSLITRNPMIVRDLDVLRRGGEAGARSESSSRCRRSTRRSGGAPSPGPLPRAAGSRRCRQLVDAGVKASVGMAPILPGHLRLARAARGGRPRRPRGRRDRRLGERPLPQARDPRALPRRARPRLAGGARPLRATSTVRAPICRRRRRSRSVRSSPSCGASTASATAGG